MRFISLIGIASFTLVSSEAMASQSKAIPPEMMDTATKTTVSAASQVKAPRKPVAPVKAVAKAIPVKPLAPITAPVSYANLSVAMPPSEEYFSEDIKQVSAPRLLARAERQDSFDDEAEEENLYVKKQPRVRTSSFDRSYLDGDLRCVAQAVYHEARGEPLSGQKAVADVVMNRAKSGKWGSSPCSVINAPYQFSNRSSWKHPRPGVPDWDRAISIAKDALSGAIGVSSRALNFRAKYMGAGGPNAFRIGNHVFW